MWTVQKLHNDSIMIVQIKMVKRNPIGIYRKFGRDVFRRNGYRQRKPFYENFTTHRVRGLVFLHNGDALRMKLQKRTFECDLDFCPGTSAKFYAFLF